MCFYKKLLVILLASLFFSCKDTEPKVVQTGAICVFDYYDRGKEPKQSLQVSVETSSDVHRVESLVVTNSKLHYTWNLTDLNLIKNDKRQWAVCPSIAFPHGQDIATGVYTCSYNDASGNKVEENFSVFYPEQLTRLKGKEVKKYLKGNYREYIAIYNENSEIIYYGEKREGWKEDRHIFNFRKKGVYYRPVLKIEEGTALCILPSVYKETSSK